MRFNLFSFTKNIFCFFSSLKISFHILSNSFCCSKTFSCISSKIRLGFISRCMFFFWPMAIILFKVATLTLKNSSRLLEKMPKKRIRSLSGTVSSAASCSTRLLNESQLISRIIIFCLDTKENFIYMKLKGTV